MSTDKKEYVLNLLKDFRKCERKIAVLRYDLEHPAVVNQAEQIDAMNFGRGDGLGHMQGHISNKTLYIALNYEEQVERLNTETKAEIANELFSLERKQKKLVFYVGLLEKRQADVIRLMFMQGMSTVEIAEDYGLTCRTIDRIKREAIENLAEMYAYTEQF